MVDVAAIGELLIDCTPGAEAHTFKANPGGAPGNVLSQLTKLGYTASFMGMVGDDAFGHMLSGALSRRGIDVSGLKHHPAEPTTLAMVHIDEGGDRSFSFYRNPGADTLFDKSDLDTHSIEDCKIFHFGGVSMTKDPLRTATLAAVDLARKAGKTVSYDPNHRAPLWGSEGEAVRWLSEGVRLCDVLKLSNEEAVLLTGCRDLVTAGEQLMAWGPRLVMITLGKDGCICCHKNLIKHFETYDTPVVDTTGAGDAFMGAVLAKLLEYGKEPAALTEEEVEAIIDFGNAAGALCATRYGALESMPDAGEIRDCMANVPKLVSDGRFQMHPKRPLG